MLNWKNAEDDFWIDDAGWDKDDDDDDNDDDDDDDDFAINDVGFVLNGIMVMN